MELRLKRTVAVMLLCVAVALPAGASPVIDWEPWIWLIDLGRAIGLVEDAGDEEPVIALPPGDDETITSGPESGPESPPSGGGEGGGGWDPDG